MIGRTLGRYLILEQIGAGGMGVVYRAQDDRLGRTVALKVLPAGMLADEAARKRFHKEALALSQLNHPNIATVHDFDTQKDVDFLVMEEIPGITLDRKLEAGGALQEKEITRYGMQLAEGLAAAHEKGVVHRDLKPGNLRITPDGRLKILDFGLAKWLHPAHPTDLTRSLSESQQAVGTLPYMAPEQVQGEPADARTDLYAAGAVLYEMATGRRPFPETQGPRLIDAILHQAPVAPRAFNPRVSPELERIALKCLEKEPETRYQSARDLEVDLRRLGASAPLAAAPPVAARRDGEGAPGGARRAALPVAAAVVILALVLGVGRWRGWWWSAPAPAGPIRSLAVLPLENFSGDASQDYFADGMTEELTAELAQLSSLRVISRTSVMQYKGVHKPLPEIARELNVDAVVEGSVLRDHDHVRITAQLIRASTDQHLWAQSYDRKLRDVLDLQSEVARDIAEQIQLTLTPQQQTRLAASRPVDPEAYEAYLQGRYFLAKRSAPDIQQAIAQFQQAVKKDPTYAPAYAGLADSYYLLPWYGTVSPLEALPQARVAATKALQLDDTLADAHASLANIELFSDWNWAGAEAEFRRALELAPGSVQAHYSYGLHYLAPRGQSDEAVAEVKRALDVDPLSLIININIGQILIYGRRYDEAIAQCRKTLALDSRFARGHSILGSAYEQKGMYTQAITEFRLNADYDPTDTLALARLARAYALSGHQAEARKILAELLRRSQAGFVSPEELAAVYLALGQKEQALTALEKAYQERDGWVIAVNVDPRFDALHSEPRFQQLVRRMGLPQ